MAFYTTYNMNEGVTLNTNVGDQIRSLIVDNYSNSWMFIPACNRYVPPNRHGFIATYLSGAQQVLVQWSTPPGFTAPQTDNTGVASVVATSDRLGQSNGTALTQPQEQTLITSSPFVDGVNPGGSFTVIAGVARERITVYGWTFTISPTNKATIGDYNILMEDASGVVGVARAELSWASNAGLASIVVQAQTDNGIPLPYGQGLIISNNAASAGEANIIGTVQYIQQ